MRKIYISIINRLSDSNKYVQHNIFGHKKKNCQSWADGVYRNLEWLPDKVGLDCSSSSGTRWFDNWWISYGRRHRNDLSQVRNITWNLALNQSISIFDRFVKHSNFIHNAFDFSNSDMDCSNQFAKLMNWFYPMDPSYGAIKITIMSCFLLFHFHTVHLVS